MELKFPFEPFAPGKQDYLFRCSNTPENFSLEQSKKMCSFYLSSNFLKMVNNLWVLYWVQNFRITWIMVWFIKKCKVYQMNVLSYMYLAMPLKNCPFCTEKQAALYAMRTHHEVAFMSYGVDIIDLHILLDSITVFIHGKQGQKN